MKPSHLTTPRTLADCHFQTGYKSADRDELTDLGHRVLTYLVVAGLVVLVPAVLIGVL